VPNSAFRAGWSSFTRDPDESVKQRYQDLMGLISQIPPDAAVTSTSTIGPHVSARDKAYRWPVLNDAEYALIRYDRLKAKGRKRYDRLIRRGWEVIDEAGKIRLLKKLSESERKRKKKDDKKKRDKKKDDKKKGDRKPLSTSAADTQTGEADDERVRDEEANAADTDDGTATSRGTRRERAPRKPAKTRGSRSRDKGGSGEGA
jgi:hypothetical protein